MIQENTMFARYTFAAAAATGMTLALLFVMNLLIWFKPIELPPERPPYELKWTRVSEDTPVKTREELPDRRELEPPIAPPTRSTETFENPGTGVYLPPPTTPTGGLAVPQGLTITDGPSVVIVRVAPIYPARAVAMGLEGQVVVQFDVTAEGQVINASVVQSTHTVFEKAAIKAAERFKFKPRVIDGIRLPSTGIQNLFTFTLDE